MSLTSILPSPSKLHYCIQPEKNQESKADENKIQPQQPLPYLHRTNFTPRTESDFGDGGSFPEIHIPQYPLKMGLSSTPKSFVNSLIQKKAPVTIDSTGSVQYDTIVKPQQNDQSKQFKKHVFTKPKDLNEVEIRSDGSDFHDLSKPSSETARAVAESTRLALESVLETRIKAAQPRSTQIDRPDNSQPTYIRYTPSQNTSLAPNTAQSRIIRMQTMPTDPLEPPKYRFRKVPTGPSSPPVPVMHSPPRRVTVQDQLNWKIPPCVSNWKNIKGYTIPLDKRLAADGRGLESVSINGRFSAFSTALYEAENVARENVRLRGDQMRKIQKQRRLQKEVELEEKARSALEKGNENEGTVEEPEREMETKEQAEARLAREELRQERMRERRRELRTEERKSRKSGTVRDRDRDISEKIALGQRVERTGETMYDQRLFNQTSGMDSGFRAEDSYDVYDRPLFNTVSQSIYKPKEIDDLAISRESRNPVEFVRDKHKLNEKPEKVPENNDNLKNEEMNKEGEILIDSKEMSSVNEKTDKREELRSLRKSERENTEQTQLEHSKTDSKDKKPTNKTDRSDHKSRSSRHKRSSERNERHRSHRRKRRYSKSSSVEGDRRHRRRNRH